MNKGKTIIVWILIIGLLGVIGYCSYQIVDRLNGSNTETKENKTEEKKDEVETELTDNSVKQDVLNKMNVILGLNCVDAASKFTLENSFVNADFREFCDSEIVKDIFKLSLTDVEKSTIALWNNNGKLVGKYNIGSNSITEANIDTDVQKELVAYYNGMVQYGGGNEMPSEIYEISADGLKNEYSKLFNNSLDETTLNSLIDSVKEDQIHLYNGTWHVTNYKYNEKNKAFYRVGSTLTASVGIFYTKIFINKITKYNDYVYVYASAGEFSVNQSTPKAVPTVNRNLLDDKFDNMEFSGDSTAATIYVRDYIIDESNYKEFTNYKFTFKKNSEGTYYFDKVEKVENQ